MPSFSPALASRLIGEHGTPLLVGGRKVVAQRFHALKDSLPDVVWLFAMKANHDRELLRWLAELGCGFDVASFAELELAHAAFASAGRKPQHAMAILHSHPCKSPSDIEGCYRTGLRQFVFDSPDELLKLKAYAPLSRLLLRIQVPQRSGQVGFAHRFGATQNDVVSLADAAQRHNMVIEGITFHVGSQTVDPEDFRSAMKVAKEAWERLKNAGHELSIIDIGGGIPIAYRDQSVASFETYLAAVKCGIDESLVPTMATIAAEPGRIICGEAVWLLTSVIGKQRRNEKVWYTIDDGRYGSFSGRYFSEQTFDFQPYSWNGMRFEFASSSLVEPSMIAGPSCDGGDIVAIDYPLPDLRVGDLLAVSNMGAYTSVSASPFNGLPRAKTIWVDAID